MSAVAEILIKGRVDPSLSRATEAASTRLSAAGLGAAKATGAATAASTRLARATNEVDRAARAAGRSTAAWERENRRISTGLGRVAQRAREAGSAIRGIGAGGRLGGLGDAATALGTGSALKRGIGASLTTEAAQVRLATAINATDKDAAVKAATASASRMSLAAPIDKTQVLDVNYALNSAGLKSDVALKGAEAVMKVATVTNGAAEQVAEVMATTYNNLGQSMAGADVDKMARIGDMMTKVQLKYQIRDFGQLGEGMAYAASTAASAQIPIEDVLMAIGQLNSAGVTGSRAGTAFTAVMRSMTKASKELGFEVVRDAKGQLDYISTLQGLNDALSQYDDLDQRNQVIQDIFGDEGKAGLIPMLQSLNQAKADRAEIANVNGLTDKEFARFVESHGGRLKVITNAFSLLGESIGNTLLPAIDLIEKPVVALAGGLSELVTEFPRLGQAIGATMAILGASAGLRMLRGGLGVLGRMGGAAAAVPAGGVPVRVMNAALGGGLGGAAGKIGKFGKVGRLLGRAGGGALAALSYAPDVIDGVTSGDSTKIGGGLGGAGGALGGAMAGAAIGSVVPVVGTMVGGILGSIVGGLGGEAFGSWVGGLFKKTAPADAAAKAESKQVTNTTTINNNVTVPAGMDADAIARALAARTSEQRRGALYDDE
ncbi:hypothetical protein KL86APRO_40043 [uncultured Alphaproteobacteria bacterium]|uniref:Phage tail tape measure protein domain-containing protein n=1 Tax=uncultured Alphaproteobacteria bacterium TaxID=91750 RepID=A0A212KMW5_9PROT|nr:hypothetical protein KL86APRO_40043 [uncultured Alphaproteobacteria bacterium]